MGEGSKIEQNQADLKLQTGLKQNLTTAVVVGGTAYTAAQVGVVLQGRIDARNATDVAKAAYAKAVAAEAAQEAASKGLVAGVKSVMLVMFAGSPDVLTAMGLSERKTATKSVSVKAGAIEKSLATRVARHTEGPKAKAKIKGAVVAPAVTPAIVPGGTGGAGHS